MESLKQNKILVSVLVLSIVIFFGYRFFGGDIEDVIVNSDASTNGGSEFVVLLERLRKVDINDSLFQSTAWNNLVDYSVILPTDQPGKSDLFGKIGQSSSPISTSSASNLRR